jgi:uncharacterized damage-inducible protein DinB
MVDAQSSFGSIQVLSGCEKRSPLMSVNILKKVFEHNNWANLQIIQVCSILSDEQLDAEPELGTKGSIRITLWHLIAAQQRYLTHLSGVDHQSDWDSAPSIDELKQAAITTGEELLALVRNESGKLPITQIEVKDGYLVEPWVIMLQVINHATEHREQIKSLLTFLGVTPPKIDGWSYGRATNAYIPPSE